MNKNDLEKTRAEIELLGLNAIKEYYKLSNDDMAKLPKNITNHLYNRARIGMQFEREMGLSNRAIEMNYLRVFRMAAEDKKEIKKLIKRSLPKYLP